MAIKVNIKNGKKIYEAYVNGTDKLGNRVQRRRRGLESIHKAREAEFEIKRELALLKDSGVSPRWGEWKLECLSIMKVQYRPSTIYSYEKTLNKWLPREWDMVDIESITKTDVHHFIFEQMPPETTMHTRKYVLKIIKRVFQVAIDHGKLEKNPCHGLMVKVPESKKSVLTTTEVNIFLREAKNTNHRFYPVWVLALFTGMRSGELYALKWSDIDMDSQIISVSRAWNSKNGFTPTKNQKTRVVPISQELLSFLKKLKLESGKSEFVLPRLIEWERGEAARIIREFCRSLSISEIKFHDLRATFITNLLAQGEPLVRVMATVGHSDMETTNVYLRLAGVELKGTTENLAYTLPADREADVLSFTR